MSFRKKLMTGIVGAALAGAGSAWAGGLPDSADADWLPAAQDVAAHPAAATAMASVPLPSAVYGALASVAMIAGLRLSRHRRWITLR